VAVSVVSETGFSPGEVVLIPSGGFYRVVSTAAGVLTLENLGYPDNAPPLTSIQSGANVGPAGSFYNLALAAALNEIAVFPSNKAAFPAYGVKYFGTDLNAAWASIPRANLTYLQNCNDWVVLIPANVYTPASTALSVIGNTVTGVARIYDWGYVGSGAVGQVVTGPGIPFGTTITSIGTVPGAFFAAAGYTLGSPVITLASTAGMYVGMTIFSGGGALVMPYSTILSIVPNVSITVSNNATATTGAVSITGAISIVANLSAVATADGTAQSFSVAVPLSISGTTNSNTSLTACSYVCNAMIGQVITGPNIPLGTTITAVAYAAATNTGTLTMSAPATGSAAGTFTFDLPSIFYCDMMRRKICNLNIGPTNLGIATTGQPQGAQFWTPQPGSDHFIDLHLQLSTSVTIYGVRASWRWCGFDQHSEAWLTHEAYASKTRLTGSFICLDPLVASSPNQHIGIYDIEVFGNPGRYIQSIQMATANGTTVLAVTNATNLWPTQTVTGPGVPVGTTIVSIAGNNVTCSAIIPAVASSPFLFDQGRLIQSIQTGTTTLGSTAVTLLTSTASLYPGQPVSGAGIPADSFVRSITSATAIVLTKAATAGAAVPLTFTPATLSFDGSLLSGTTTNFLGTFKSRWRSTFFAPTHFEIAMAGDVEWSAPMFAQQYSHIENCAFKGGFVWTANSVNFDIVGLYDCEIYTTAAFIGIAGAPLRIDDATNYWFRKAQATLDSVTPKTLLAAAGLQQAAFGASALVGVAAAASIVPPGSSLLTTNTSTPGVLSSQASEVAAFSMRHLGNALNVAGQTIAYDLRKTTAAGVTSTLATITLATNVAAGSAGSAAFVPVSIDIGDFTFVRATPSAILTAVVTDIMGSTS